MGSIQSKLAAQRVRKRIRRMDDGETRAAIAFCIVELHTVKVSINSIDVVLRPHRTTPYPQDLLDRRKTYEDWQKALEKELYELLLHRHEIRVRALNGSARLAWDTYRRCTEEQKPRALEVYRAYRDAALATQRKVDDMKWNGCITGEMIEEEEQEEFTRSKIEENLRRLSTLREIPADMPISEHEAALLHNWSHLWKSVGGSDQRYSFVQMKALDKRDEDIRRLITTDTATLSALLVLAERASTFRQDQAVRRPPTPYYSDNPADNDSQIRDAEECGAGSSSPSASTPRNVTAEEPDLSNRTFTIRRKPLAPRC